MDTLAIAVEQGDEVANSDGPAPDDCSEHGSASVPSAGDMLEASVTGDEVGSFAGRDEPAEISYDYAEADRRAVDVLRRVAEAEGDELTPRLASRAVGGLSFPAFEVGTAATTAATTETPAVPPSRTTRAGLQSFLVNHFNVRARR
jgi:hypothetical protein